MKNKLKLLFVVSIISIVACKKKDEAPNNLVQPYRVAYVKGIVLDSLTGLPLAGSTVICHGPASVTDSTGRYVAAFGWGGDLRLGNNRPWDTANVYISAIHTGRSGDLFFRAGSLVENDTIDLPTIYVH